MKGTLMNYRLGTLGLIAAMVLSLPSHAQDEAPAEEESSEAANGVNAMLCRSLYFSAIGNYVRAANARGTDDGRDHGIGALVSGYGVQAFSARRDAGRRGHQTA